MIEATYFVYLQIRTPIMKKIIFLDFDGVLNTDRYQKRLRESGSATSDRYGPLFDPAAVKNLAEVIRATGAEVYLITSWVLENPEGMKSLWKDRNMPGKLLPHIAPQAAIPDNVEVFLEADDPAEAAMSMSLGLGKGNDIDAFLDSRFGKCKYVIFDDTADFNLSQKRYLVQTDPSVGITAEDAARAIELLR